MGILAIDAGTTGVTALVVTPGGRIDAHGHAELRQHRPEPDRLEHTPEEIWQATIQAIRDCLRAWGGEPGDLSGIGIANPHDTVVLWDRETLGSPRRAIASQDRRTADICRGLRDEGHEGRVTELTGLRLDPRFAGTKLVWLAEHEPRTWALVATGRYAVGTVDSFLVARMTRGTWHVTDVSNASRTLLFDLEAGAWSEELCELFGVPMDALPEVVPSWGRLARTEPRSFLGLDLPIAGIAGDQSSALFGRTCFDAGDSTCTYGAGAVLTTTGARLVRPDAGLLSTAAWRSPAGETTYALEALVAPRTTQAHSERASREEIAYQVRAVTEAMPVTLASLVVGGAASADDQLCQLQADVLGVPVRRPGAVGTTTPGVAFMAGLGTGVWDSLDDVRESWDLDREFTPDASEEVRERARSRCGPGSPGPGRARTR